MPSAIKRRKLSTIQYAPNKPRGLDVFTKVSKASSTDKIVLEKNSYVDTIAITSVYSTTGQKRKLVHAEEGISEEGPASICREIRPLPSRRSQETRLPQTPQNPITTGSSPSSIDTPTKGARSLLDRFCITTKTPTRSALSFNSFSSNLVASTPSPTQQPSTSQDLPTELLDLINLHAAFLTALSLHYAHNGTHSPADLRMLCPDVSRAWGKRRVVVDDIRRTIGVLNVSIPDGSKDHRISRLSLSDYGHGKICIEIRTSAGKVGRVPRPVNENLLNEIFVRGLKASWEKAETEINGKDFIESLPMEPITTCPSLLKMSPLLAKGQRRLEEMKAGIMVKKEAKVEETITTNGVKPTLLERLRAKQLQQSTLPPPPSKAELAHKQALQRIEEVVSVLTILSTSSSVGQQRISFTLPTVLGKLRDSFKTPMSKEEGTTCVRLLAAEIAPEWVKIVKMGKVEALVVNRDERPGESDIKERVRLAAGIV
jgi:hypothetical protein